MKAYRLPTLGYSLAALVVLLDQASKHWVVGILRLPERREIEVSKIFDLRFVWNRGVSFGLFSTPEGQETVRWALAVFSLAVAAALGWMILRSGRALMAAAFGLIMGGALGNMIDRVRFGAVADFLDFSGLGFPWVFNIADAAINIGVALLLIDMVRQPKAPGA